MRVDIARYCGEGRYSQVMWGVCIYYISSGTWVRVDQTGYCSEGRYSQLLG